MSPGMRRSFNLDWFKNEEGYNYTPLLIRAYMQLNKERGISFEKSDIIQIVNDYCIVFCSAYYQKFEFMDEYVVNQIVRILTNHANQCLNFTINEGDIKKTVLTDLKEPLSIYAATDFISHF